MTTPRALPESLANRAFTVAEARRYGEGPNRMRRADLRSPVHGVRVLRDREVGLVECIALVLRPEQRFSHTTAACLWGAPVPRAFRDATSVHVATVGTASLMRRPGVTAHRATDHDTAALDGLPLSAPARAWAECATLLDLRSLVVLGDHLVGRAGLATIEDLGRALRPRGHGVVRARAALEAVRPGSESPMETLIRLDVVDAGFPEPELNREVFDERGTFLGRVDMCWPQLRIALEYDGDHHREREVFRHDQRRGNGFAVNGWIVVHATAADAARPAVLFERLRQAFASRA
ncbi:hypothetical protein C1N91_14385 [Curtobacterium sp. SGAir0471]|uniref:hypothetical protein n=1 Tax=Curtobacterium sp. SGAir0471 TaxID=2070337 RepID=UPI0010CCFACB|nr:hypothetical protein [Curtobacterium sp. SGAir0471]QCR44527.1 hypothetical protein C1N91_14385 [Curtobacterium sp. SGAir0471]